MDGTGIRSVLTGLRVLERLADPGLVGVSELARDLGLPKSSVQRMLLTLKQGGWAIDVHSEATRWTLTSNMLRLGQRHQAGNDLRAIALPVMEHLLQETRETVHLSIPNGDTIFVAESLESSQPVRAHVSPGATLPLLATANGQALLSTWSDEAIEELLSKGLTAYTPFTMTDSALVNAAIRQARVRGYGVNEQQWREGVHGIAAPIVVGGTGVAGIGISTPIHRMSGKLEEKFGRMLIEAARAIAHGLGEAL